MHLSALDWIIAVLAVVICFFPALFFGKRSSKNTSEFFASGRSVPWWLAGLSIVATETSTLTLIGVPALAFSTFARPEEGGNLTYLQVVFGYMIARVVISLVLLPAYFHGELMTAYELLQRNPNPSDEEIRTALSGNICRCTGYQHIVDAVRAAAQAMAQTSATTPSGTR